MISCAIPFCCSRSPPAVTLTPFEPLRIFSYRARVLLSGEGPTGVSFNADGQKKLLRKSSPFAVSADIYSSRRKSVYLKTAATSGGDGSVSELNNNVRRLLRALLWFAEGVYIFWLFFLPYAPGDPVWAISSETISSLIGLSLNFFFILPLCNSVGVNLVTAPVLHPVSEGLFNFVIGWTVLFGPLLYSDKWRDKFKGSLDVLWGCQLFLTNTFLIPYMAIRLNKMANGEYTPRKDTMLGSIMTTSANVVGLVGGGACLLSILWALYGRGDSNYGGIPERWEFLLSYIGTERLAYAFIWDICLYLIFQPWLIGDNLQNIQSDKVAVVNALRFFPVVGIVAYCLCLNSDNEM
ncbi:uncharacterized protein LOC127245337 [Andrographis paniculata]|uniref:uncharacterized protein LOC127245337 n=1 Tax=Andrographis paniculata TaxID=175694 RepID=UPI0021E80B5D|nr:uncharacterized protein LOC127245337 [Andrographis paniculata]